MNIKAMLEAGDPARQVGIPTADSPTGREILSQTWSVVEAPDSTDSIDRRGRARQRMYLGAAPVAAAIVLIVVLLALPNGSPTSAASAMLDQAARNVALDTNQPSAGQYLYTETQSSYQATLYGPDASSNALMVVATAHFGETVQEWSNAGATDSRTTDSTIEFQAPDSPVPWNSNASASSLLQRVTDYAQNGGQTVAAQPALDVSKLPSDPTALATILADGQFGTNIDMIPAGPNAVFERAAVLLLSSTVNMSTSLESVLFEVLAAQPGIQLLGMVTDHEGQSGQAVRLVAPSNQMVSEVVVDSTTGELLEADFAPPGQPNFGDLCTVKVPEGSPGCTSSSSDFELGLGPVWTDVVASGVVGSSTATVPSFGNAPTTVAVVPAAPTDLIATIGPVQTASSGGSEQVDLSWSAPLDAGGSPIVDYVIYEYQDGQSPSTGVSGVIDTHSSGLKYVLNLLASGQTPTVFTVQAVNSNGYGLPSEPVALTP